MNPQSPQEMQQMVDSIASQKLGANPNQPPQQQPQANPAPTPQEQAVAKMSPATEGDKQQAEAAIMSLDMGNGQKRDLSESQVKGMLDRYRNMNFQNMQNKPIMDAATQAMQQLNMNPQQFVQHMGTLMQQAQQKNTQFGGQDEHPNKQTPPPNQGADPKFDEMLKKWEDDNAASLPPGYKDMLAQNQQMAQGMQQMQQMIQQFSGQQNGQVRAAQQAYQGVGQQQQANLRDAIGNNLNRVQAQLQLGDDTAPAFMEFAAERGYLLEDFVDPQLTMKVAQDFKNAANSGELQRLQEVAKRRQAYSGAADPTATGAAGQSPAQGDNTLDQLTSFIRNKR